MGERYHGNLQRYWLPRMIHINSRRERLFFDQSRTSLDSLSVYAYVAKQN